MFDEKEICKATKVDFRYFISLALQNKMPWESLAFVLDDLASTLPKSKEIIQVLLKELHKLESRNQEENSEAGKTDGQLDIEIENSVHNENQNPLECGFESEGHILENIDMNDSHEDSEEVVEIDSRSNDSISDFEWPLEEEFEKLPKASPTTFKHPKNKKMVCAMSHCNNPSGLKYHRFPANEARSKEWKILCNRLETFKVKHAYICQSHFSAQCYINNDKNVRQRLKPTAKPDINLPFPTQDSILPDSESFQINFSLDPSTMKLAKSPRKVMNYKRKCVVPGCNSKKNLSYHRIPSNPTRQREWITAINSSEGINPSKDRICELHFTKESYERDLKHELMNTKMKRKSLKLDAVPTLNL